MPAKKTSSGARTLRETINGTPTPAAASLAVDGAPSMEKIIFTYVSRIASERDIDRLLLLLADLGRDIVGADRCTVWLINPKTGDIWSKVSHGLDRITIPKGHGIAGSVAADGKPLIINDPYSDDRFDKDVDKRTGYRTRSILALPIADADGRTIGVYQAINKKTGAFTTGDQDHLLLASTYTSEVLKSAQAQEEIEATQREIIFTMAEAGEARSKETGYHVKRVSEYCRLLAVKRGMSDTEAEVLRLSSPMHDIGKIAIPDSILLKPGRLTDEERKVMMTHAALGYYILNHSERRLLRSAAIVAYQHHERWDGAGYPCGIKGEAIHVYGRVAAVADVFDALASDRVYKKAWELPRIIELFEAERGKQFDPDLATAFLENVDAFVKIKDAYVDASSAEAAAPSCDG